MLVKISKTPLCFIQNKNQNELELNELLYIKIVIISNVAVHFNLWHNCHLEESWNFNSEWICQLKKDKMPHKNLWSKKLKTIIYLPQNIEFRNFFWFDEMIDEFLNNNN